jgi:hypothetical protein
MLAAFADRLDQKVGRAVGDEMLLGEGGIGGDEDSDLHDALDLFQIAERRLGLSQNVDGAGLGRFLAGRYVGVAAEQAGDEPACRPLSGNWPAVSSRLPSS